MYYQITATKKRPKDFDSLIGQEFVKSTLLNSLKNDSLANAYLFSGPRGVGKTSTARLLAKYICNPNLKNLTKDEDFLNINYDGMEEITKGLSPDVIEIDGASNTSVDDIRKLKENIIYKPMQFHYKIYIIDEVHMLSNSAFNALLKTIEEPPEYVIFIFATTELHKIPATIKSRTQHFNFRLVPLKEIQNLLIQVCKDNNTVFQEDALLWIAKESDGSIRDAYTLFDQVLAFCKDDKDNEINLEKIKEKLSLLGITELNEMLKIILVDNDKNKGLTYLHTLIDSGIAIEQINNTLIEYFRSIILIKQGIKSEYILNYNKDDFEKEILELDEDRIIKILDLLFDFYKNIKNSLDLKIEFEIVFLKICNIKNYITQSELLKVLDSLKISIEKKK